jgi:hypothetical protein
VPGHQDESHVPPGLNLEIIPYFYRVVPTSTVNGQISRGVTHNTRGVTITPGVLHISRNRSSNNREWSNLQPLSSNMAEVGNLKANLGIILNYLS